MSFFIGVGHLAAGAMTESHQTNPDESTLFLGCDTTWKLFAIARNLNCHRNPVSETRYTIREPGLGAIACTLGNRAFC